MFFNAMVILKYTHAINHKDDETGNYNKDRDEKEIQFSVLSYVLVNVVN